MDLRRPITYRTLTLNGAEGGPGGNQPIDGMRIVRVRYGNVQAVGYKEKRALDDGLDASDTYLAGRDLTIMGEVFGQNKARLFDSLDLLRLKFTATDAYAESPATRGYLPLAFSQPTEKILYYPSGFVDRVLNVRPVAQPEHDIEFGPLGGNDSRGFVVPYVSHLEARDPRFYAPTEVSTALDGAAGTVSGTLTNRGNYPTPLNFTFFRAAADSAESVHHFTGMGTDMEVTIPAGGVNRSVLIDSKDKVCLYVQGSSTTLRMDLVEFNAGTTWPRVPPTPEGDSPAGWTLVRQKLSSPSRMFFIEAWA